MGGSHGKPRVLDCMLKNFRKGFGGNYRVRMTPGHLCTLCELEWQGFDVGWPSEVTLDLPTICRGYIVVTGTPGHPDQFPYIDSRLEIARIPPPWVWFCSNSKGQSRVLVARNHEAAPRKTRLRSFTRETPMKSRRHLPMHHGQRLVRPRSFQTLRFQPRLPGGPNPTSLEPDFIGLAGIESD
ncbi:hypothetical protein mRhiFer1_007892 [Rhinolophus ferrumequinum]|uniref:Gamma-retroviral matrix protein domain-containing protein n=1 Tax=Rhinolophus ferrumequinum TaxID=59479 RepID=A0A7J8AV75_RHIFE|nr:hypothetical protein mRhiFer1_007892 [Rhinolophus ferrumequinum]